MSNSSDANELKRTGGFASRLLNKELTERKKTTTQLSKVTVADAAKYAVTQQVAEETGKKEGVSVGG